MFCLESGFWPNCSPSLPVAGGQVSSSSLTCPPSTSLVSSSKSSAATSDLQGRPPKPPKPVAVAVWPAGGSAHLEFFPSVCRCPTGSRPMAAASWTAAAARASPICRGRGRARSFPLERRSGTFPIRTTHRPFLGCHWPTPVRASQWGRRNGCKFQFLNLLPRIAVLDKESCLKYPNLGI